MNNEQFRNYIEQRIEDITAELNGSEQLSSSAIKLLKEQEELLNSALKIMKYGTGQERRRFRRDYERRVALKREMNELKEVTRLSKGLADISAEG